MGAGGFVGNSNDRRHIKDLKASQSFNDWLAISDTRSGKTLFLGKAFRMGFRPALWMTVFSVIALGILVTLGSWQIYRMQWKAELIAEFEDRAHSAPIPVTSLPLDEPPRYQRVFVEGVWLHEHEVQLTGRTFEGTAGYHIITPLRQDDGVIILVNRGWVSQDYRDPNQRLATLTSGLVKVDGIVRLPAKKGYFVPENDPEDGDWFTLSIADISQYSGLGDSVVKTFTVDALRPDGPYVLPIGAGVNITLPNNHLQYALTWYGIALGLVGVYFSWHRQAGRLGHKEKS